MEKKKPSYFKYEGHEPVAQGQFANKKNTRHIRIFVWKSRKEMNHLALTKKERKRGIAEAIFHFKYTEKGSWVGDIHFYQQKIKFDWIAHEATHAATRWLVMEGKLLNGRNEETFASMVGSVSHEIAKWLKTKKGIKLVL